METVTGAGAPRLRFPPVNDAHAASLPARRCQTAGGFLRVGTWHGKQGQNFCRRSIDLSGLAC
jgi:hypothetical protein